MFKQIKDVVISLLLMTVKFLWYFLERKSSVTYHMVRGKMLEKNLKLVIKLCVW